MLVANRDIGSFVDVKIKNNRLEVSSFILNKKGKLWI